MSRVESRREDARQKKRAAEAALKEGFPESVLDGGSGASERRAKRAK
jgi:hypothetical protein